jgi:hypothetical protein
MTNEQTNAISPMNAQTITIDKSPVKEIVVETNKRVLPSKIGSAEFEAALLLEFTGKHEWRSSTGLAKKLGVDAKELESFLDKDKRFVRSAGEEDGSWFYAVKKRLDTGTETCSNKTKVKTKITLSPEDRYALGQLNLLSVVLDKVLDNYALRVMEQSEEALSHLTRALKHLKAGTALYATETKANPEHLITL